MSHLPGTKAAIAVLFQETTVAFAPLNVTVLLPWLPNPAPVIATVSPVFPELGFKLAMLSPDETVNVIPLLPAPPTETTTLPDVAPVGTGAVIRPSLQLTGIAVVPLNFTVLVPWLVPKLAPAIVTVAPIPPEVGVRLVYARSRCFSKRGAVAWSVIHGDNDRAAACSLGHQGCDFSRGPACYCGWHTVKCHGARTLTRTKIRSVNGYAEAGGTGGWR